MGVRTALFVYQRKLTYQIPSQCIYTPSCSEFGRQCFEYYGPIKATLLTMDRLTRCSPTALSGLSRFDRVTRSGRTLYLDPPSRYRFRPVR
jgi:putative component of membrane protein insertase Oxa1/YidC/SpoIIIJ protein YidD